MKKMVSWLFPPEKGLGLGWRGGKNPGAKAWGPAWGGIKSPSIWKDRGRYSHPKYKGLDNSGGSFYGFKISLFLVKKKVFYLSQPSCAGSFQFMTWSFLTQCNAIIHLSWLCFTKPSVCVWWNFTHFFYCTYDLYQPSLFWIGTYSFVFYFT